MEDEAREQELLKRRQEIEAAIKSYNEFISANKAEDVQPLTVQPAAQTPKNTSLGFDGVDTRASSSAVVKQVPGGGQGNDVVNDGSAEGSTPSANGSESATNGTISEVKPPRRQAAGRVRANWRRRNRGRGGKKNFITLYL
ncbi:uncharacterized protein LOC141526588 [Cotesia typhae]|uniref:uncharacterized protein LOC141526588 n=1 Tax=Cotesia typhae TaxID=2053667 RepID=UPI003D682026